MPSSLCLKCGHDVTFHAVKIIGMYDSMVIACKAQGEDYHDSCDCNAGFPKMIIKKEFINEEKTKPVYRNVDSELKNQCGGFASHR